MTLRGIPLYRSSHFELRLLYSAKKVFHFEGHAKIQLNWILCSKSKARRAFLGNLNAHVLQTIIKM